ncbi:MAG: preprotein translocase subunit SecE [Mycoplasmataceae bacterium]|nr:preprotein translocase subunit SecE [Mycoplasmataceae bacterium]
MEKKHRPSKTKTPEDKISYKIKRWFFGLGKEFNRISWTPRKKMIFNFFVIIAITTIFVLIFLLIDFIFLKVI